MRDNSTSNLDVEFERAKKELDSVADETKALETQGKLDKEAEKRLENRFQLAFARLEHASEQQVRELLSPRASPRRAITLQAKLFFVLHLLGLTGALFEIALGQHFVFFFNDAYKSLLPVLVGLIVLVFATQWFIMEKQTSFLTAHYPTYAVRWFAAFPVFSLFSSAIFIMSIWGWAALAGLVVGVQAPPQTAIVLSVSSYGNSRNCDQKAVLKINGMQSKICLARRVVGPSPRAGDSVLLYGRLSVLGLYVEKIRVKQAS